MFSYRPNFIPNSVVLIGAGGTGSRLMPALSQLVRTCISKFNPQAWLQHLPIYVIDGDIVEEKNLLRQNFISKDVGQYKSVVVANRYSNAFQIPIYPSSAFLKSDTVALTFSGDPNAFTFNNSIVVLAVDSANARRDILQFIFGNKNHGLASQPVENRNIFVIDAGNEDAFGQVKFFTNSALTSKGLGSNRNFRDSFPKSTPIVKETSFIPFDTDYYRNLGGSAAELSCVDLPQTLAINNMMAALLCSVVQNFLYMKPMNFDCIRFGLDGSMYTELNTARRWLTRRVPINSSDPFEVSVNKCVNYINPEHEPSIFTSLLVDSRAAFKNAGLVIGLDGELYPEVVPEKIVKPDKPKPESPIEKVVEVVEAVVVEPPAAEMPQLVRVETPVVLEEGEQRLPPLPPPVPRRRRPAVPINLNMD